MRLFIGLPLSSEYALIIRKIQEAWKKRLASKMSWVRPELAHVTLKFLGEVDGDRVGAIVQAMREAARGSFEMQGGRGRFFFLPWARRV
jgi:2''-5'' RNA ligase